MIRKGKKVISVFAVILLVALTALPAVAVYYPEGITKEQVSATIDKTDILIETFVAATPEGSLENIVLPKIYSDEVISALTGGLYGAMEENSESLSALGLDTSVKGVAKHLSAYPDVQQKLASVSKWSEVNLEGAKWNVSDKEGFINAVASVMSPFNDVLYMLLCGGRYSLNRIIGLEGAKGYETAIIPTLKALGCESITDSAVFYAEAKADRKAMVKNLVGDVLKLFEGILEAPCDTLTDILPGIAYFMNNGGLDKAVSTLIQPLRLQLFNISTFIKIERLLSFIQNSESFTQDFTLNFNDILSSSGLKMAEINLQELSDCGTVNADGSVTSDKPATFMVLMRWMIDSAKLNKDSMGDILGEETAEMSGIIDSLMAKNTDDIITLVVKLLNAEKGETNDYVWSFGAFESLNVSYTQNLSKEKFQRVVDGIDELLDQFIAEGGEYKTVRDAIAPEIYSNSLVSTLVCEIYGMLSGEEMKAIASVAGLDVTPAVLASHLREARFVSTRYALSKASSWDKVNERTLTWGFRNGDKDGFKKALCAALRPMEDIIAMLLCEGKIQIAGCIDVYGSNGYNTAVIPLLEALGCDSDSILTYEEYKKASSKGKGIEAIVNSLMSLVERVLDRPVYTITEILPNLLYFINNKGIETCLENLMYPLMKILKELGMENMLDMSALDEMNMEELMADMMKGQDLGVDLGSIDFSGFDINEYAKMGEIVTVQSKRAQNGEFVNISYVKADQTAIMVSLMRYIATMMKNPEMDLMGSFMGSADGNEMISGFTGGITEDLEKMTVDETVEWLYKLLFRERPIVEEKTEEEYMPTIIYVEKSKAEGTTIYFLFLFVALAEVIYLKNKEKINSFIKEKVGAFKDSDTQTTQEV